MEKYIVPDGTQLIGKDLLEDRPGVSEVFIPASVGKIADGAFSNAGSWVDENRGVSYIEVDSRNPRFFTDCSSLFERRDAKGLRLVYYFGIDKKAVIPKETEAIAEGAFKGASISEVYFEESGSTVYFPFDHKFHLEKLLEGFGKNGQLYDFADYDSFLLQNRVNPVRIKMTCTRLLNGFMLPDSSKELLYHHIADNIEAVLSDLASAGNAVNELRLMSEAGFFTKENIDPAIEILNRTKEREMLHFLMQYKNAHFPVEEYDFTI